MHNQEISSPGNGVKFAPTVERFVQTIGKSEVTDAIFTQTY
jgi:hypothetical protein